MDMMESEMRILVQRAIRLIALLKTPLKSNEPLSEDIFPTNSSSSGVSKTHNNDDANAVVARSVHLSSSKSPSVETPK